MKNNRPKKLSFIKNASKDIQIEFYYRYLSLIITSIFYLLGDYDQTISTKLFFILCITVSALALTYLYIEFNDSKGKIKLLILIETVGNSLILIPLGGLNSPYIWYALNTILISSLKLDIINCWINLAIYICCSTGIAYYIIGESEIGLLEFISNESSLMISFVLITAALQLMRGLFKSLEKEKEITAKKNRQLIEANKRVNQSMECVMAFYQAVHSFKKQSNNDETEKMLLYYTKRISKAKKVFFYRIFKDENTRQNELIIEADEKISESFEVELSKAIAEKWNKMMSGEGLAEILVCNERFVFIVVKSIHMEYGLLGIEIEKEIESLKNSEEFTQLRFMGELASIVFEKAYMEEVNEGLLINEEQNRIANEIHDSVLQRLFGISSGMFVMIRKMESMSPKEIRRELNAVRTSIDGTMKELRRTIYDISWEKSGRNVFKENLENFINEIKNLNDVSIAYEINGKQELMPYRYKRVIYRIVSEVVSNALRHGKASSIDIAINIKAESISLEIADNGLGFDFEEVKRRGNMGLGIKNICYLAESLNGRTLIDSKLGKGTKVRTEIPNGYQNTKEGKAV